MSNNYQQHTIPPPYDTEHRMYTSPGNGYYGEEKSGMCGVLGRIPYLTILGVLLIAAGSVSMMYGYKQAAEDIYDTYEAMGFAEALKTDWECKDCEKFIREQREEGKDSYYSPENAEYIITDSIIAGVGVLFLIVLAILGTGLTRERCCHARPCCQGYAMFTNFVTGLVVLILFLAFLGTSVILLAPTLGSELIKDQCKDTPADERPCFESLQFGFVDSSTGNGTSSNICFGDPDICSRIDNLRDGFCYLCSGAFGISLGLMFSLMAIAANFAHFRDMKKVESEEKYVF